MLLALKMERELSKDEILELYLNKSFFGNRAYGVAAAAEFYYGKTARPADPGRDRDAGRRSPSSRPAAIRSSIPSARTSSAATTSCSACAKWASSRREQAAQAAGRADARQPARAQDRSRRALRGRDGARRRWSERYGAECRDQRLPRHHHHRQRRPAGRGRKAVRDGLRRIRPSPRLARRRGAARPRGRRGATPTLAQPPARRFLSVRRPAAGARDRQSAAAARRRWCWPTASR